MANINISFQIKDSRGQSLGNGFEVKKYDGYIPEVGEMMIVTCSNFDSQHDDCKARKNCTGDCEFEFEITGRYYDYDLNELVIKMK